MRYKNKDQFSVIPDSGKKPSILIAGRLNKKQTLQHEGGTEARE